MLLAPLFGLCLMSFIQRALFEACAKSVIKNYLKFLFLVLIWNYKNIKNALVFLQSKKSLIEPSG
ncbi:hypothetical protein AOD82_0201445 [Helicobacter pylori]|nr:hypothetical protein AOD79_0204215 [Helicobacter pylori]OKB12822.1 hypothetical protein AOD80_0203480 [Helicobacter pylori]OKB25324.1 hypothetical protein AOD82_0201445 [Helicobacter pylori]